MDGGSSLLPVMPARWLCVVAVCERVHSQVSVSLVFWRNKLEVVTAFNKTKTAKKTQHDTGGMVGVKARDERQRRVDAVDDKEAKRKGRQGETILPQGASSHPSEGKFWCVPWLYPGLLNKRYPRPPRINTPSHLTRAIVPAAIIISSLWCMNWGISCHLWGVLRKWEWRRSSKTKWQTTAFVSGWTLAEKTKGVTVFPPAKQKAT